MPKSRVQQDPQNSEGSEVYINVYDLWENNKYAYYFGLGIYHSGVEVYDSEYAYGAHDNSASGIFETAPKGVPGTVGLRMSIYVGHTMLSRREVDAVCEELGDEFRGNQYHLLARNCNHFTGAFVKALTGTSAPGWVNRLAGVGLCCSCILPRGLNPPLPPSPARGLRAEEDTQLLFQAGASSSASILSGIGVASDPSRGVLRGSSARAGCPVPHPGMQRV
mmetsp:Transcript_18528/g.40543  ORF Transcript_18528/g.40543 Transcript_18528/m.40543 type:complete len:221 (-) Transcript_18528:3718-4380(-)